MLILPNPYDDQFMNHTKFLLKFMDGCYEDTQTIDHQYLSLTTLCQYSQADTDLLELGQNDLVHGPLHDIQSHDDHLSQFENLDHIGGMFQSAIHDLSHNGINFAQHHGETVGGFHTVDHYFNDQPDLGYDLHHMPGHSLDAMHLDYYNELSHHASTSLSSHL